MTPGSSLIRRVRFGLLQQKVYTVPPAAQSLFESLCKTANDVDVDGLRLRVQQHLDEIRRAAHRNELLPVDVAEQLAKALEGLLREADALTPEQRTLAIGAARYFCSEHDHVHDTSSVLGLDDDVAVFNLAVREIGREDLILDL